MTSMRYEIDLSEQAARQVATAAATTGITPEQYIQRFLEAWSGQLTDEARDRDQAWFWAPEWQAGECAADADLAAGRSTRYDSDEEFLSALEAHVADPSSYGKTESDADA